MVSRAALLLPWLALAPGCTCSKQPEPAPRDVPQATSASANPAPLTSSAAPTSDGPALFSAPIAGARRDGQDAVAALVAQRGVIAVTGMSAGHSTWTTDALSGVAWGPDAELTLQSAPGGYALVWRGMRAGKSGRTLVILGLDGKPQGDPVDVGPAFCVTDAGVAWVEAHSGAPARVLARAWSEAAPHPVGVVPTDRDGSLACGARDVVVLGDGDDDLTMAPLTPGDAAMHAPVIVARDADFGEDEEREHDAYTVGDDLGLVRIGASGAVAVREVPKGGTATPWRRFKHAIPSDDDVVAVDGDGDTTLVVYTQDADEACPGVGSTAETVRALRISRKTGDEAVLELAPADCSRSPGPFWIASTPSGQAVGWIERQSKSSATAPPITGAQVRLVGATGVQTRHIDQPADALVDSGCDTKGCSLAALVRPVDGDGMQPESLRTLAYP